MTDLTSRTVAAAIRRASPQRPRPAHEAAAGAIEATSRVFDVPVEDLVGPGRQRVTVDARQVAMAVIRATTTLSFPEIGEVFRRDHTSVISAVKRVLAKPMLTQWAAAVDAEMRAVTEANTRTPSTTMGGGREDACNAPPARPTPDSAGAEHG